MTDTDIRDLIVVDVETTGLDPRRHHIVEVAAINITSGDEMRFVPYLPTAARECMEFGALRVNKYVERALDLEALTPRETDAAYNDLFEMIAGHTLAGSNPTFDASMLESVFVGMEFLGCVPWHFRLADLSAYAAGVMGLPPTKLPGLATVCELLGVTNTAPHTALGDARATADCFRTLDEHREKLVRLS